MWMAWRTLRWHPGSVMGVLTTLVIAATVISALWFVVDSTERQPPVIERYAGAAMVITTGGIPGAIPPGLVTAVGALPEVTAAVPELSFVAPLSVRGNVVRVAGDQYPSPWGHGWGSARLTPFRIQQGRPPRVAGEVVVDARLAEAARVTVGERVDVRVSGVSRSHEVVGVAATSARWRHQSALFFTDGHAAKLAGRRSGVDTLGVLPQPGTDPQELRQAVARVLQPYNPPGAQVIRIATGADRGAAEGNLSSGGGPREGFNTLWFLVYTAGLIAVGMVAAAMGLSIRRRSTEIAVLRAVGARRGQIRRMLLAEGLLFSLVAVMVAVPLGRWIAPLVADRLRDFGVVNVSFEVFFRPLPALWTLLFTVAVALLASLLAVRRALRIRPGDALGEAPAEGGTLGRGRLLTGLALLAVAFVLALLQVADLVDFGQPLGSLIVEFARVCLVVAAVGLVAPWFVLAVGRLLRPWAARARRAGGFLSVANVVFNHRRFAGAVGSLTLGVTLVGVIVSTQSFYDWRQADLAAAEVSADHVLTPAVGNNVLAEELRRRLQNGHGTAEVVGVQMLPITATADDWTPAEGPPPRTYGSLVTGNLMRMLNLPVRGRPLNALGEREVALSDSMAARDKARIGSRLRIRFPGATRDEVYTVAALYPDSSELAALVLPSLGPSATHLSAGPYVALYVRGPLDREAVSEAGATVASYDKQGYVLRKAAESAERNRLLPYISVLIALFCLVAAVNSLCLALLDRRREWAAMRQIGMRRGQVMWMVCGENVLTVLPVLVLALAAVVAVASVSAMTEGAGPAAMVSFIPFGWLTPLGGGALLGALVGSLLVVRTAMKNER
ncbi:ABC transporter permease [Nonomuraea africana]